MTKNFFKTAILVLLLTNGAFISNANAQVIIGTNKEPESFSLLELVGDGTNGLRLPQMTTAERDTMAKTFNASTLAMGLQIFNTTSKCVETWNGYTWIEICGEPVPEPDYVEITCGGITTRWAKWNVDMPGTFTEKPEDVGMFYQWNRLTAWAATGTVTGWNTSTPTGTKWEEVNNPCPDGWRVPTREELDALCTCYEWEWVANYKESGVSGGQFGSPTNHIFLPAAGCRYYNNGTLRTVGSNCRYWSSTDYVISTSINAYFLEFQSNYAIASLSNAHKAYGFSVRCVKK